GSPRTHLRNLKKQSGAPCLFANDPIGPACGRPQRGANMSELMFPTDTREFSHHRRQLHPEIDSAFQAISKVMFADGAMSAKTKQIIAVAVAHVTQCPYCIKGHTKAALRSGASDLELMEAIWVAAEMRAGAAYAHSALALEEMKHAADAKA